MHFLEEMQNIRIQKFYLDTLPKYQCSIFVIPQVFHFGNSYDKYLQNLNGASAHFLLLIVLQGVLPIHQDEIWKQQG